MFLGRGLALGGGDRGLAMRGGQSKQQQIDALFATLGCQLVLHCRETSGDPVNTGSASLTITQTNCTQNQAGAIATPDAYDFNGTDSVITVTNGAGSFLRSLASQGWCFVINVDGAGENSSARLYSFGAANNYLQFDDATRILFAQIQSSGGAASTKTTTTIPTGVWRTIFLNYDNAGDRMIHLYVGTSSGVAEVTYAGGFPIAAIGTITSQTSTLYFGNRNNSGFDRTMDGRADLWAVRNSVWTLTEMTNINNLFLAA